jgi:hypothetical protein
MLVPATAIGLADITSIASARMVPLFTAASVTGTMNRLSSPRIALYQPWVTSMDEGWTRLLLDTLGIEYRTLRNKDFSRKANLAGSTDVLILADMGTGVIVDGKGESSEQGEPVIATPEWPEEYRGGIGTDGVEALKTFIKEGGTLVAMGAATDFAIDKLRVPATNLLKDASSKEYYAPGTIVRLNVDSGHRLAWGMNSATDAYITDNHALRLLPYRFESSIVATFAAEHLLSSGWLLGEEKLEGKIAMAEIPYGKGRVILYGFRVQHRAQTFGTFKLLLNALLKSTPQE